MQRRNLLITGLMGGSTLALSGCGVFNKKANGQGGDTSKGDLWQQRLAAIEARTGGRLGVSVRLSGQSRDLTFHGDDRFPMCSTFKLLLAAQILQKSQLAEFSLDQALLYEKSDLVPYSPVTEKHADFEGMTVRALAEAAVVVSDNTAANLLLGLQGGPAGLTQWLRMQGDMKTRLDRREPELNAAVAGDLRDTTTPQNMSRTVLALLTDKTGQLNPESRKQLIDWLRASRTGDKRLRAGMPADWTVAGKTGSGENGTTNEVSLVWPGAQDHAPMLVSVYLTGALKVDAAGREAALAEVGRVVADWYKSKR